MKLSSKVVDEINNMKEESLAILTGILKIPSIAAKKTGHNEAISFLKKEFEKAGFNCFIAKTDGNPVLCAEMNVGADKTLTFYDHYDVQPEEPVELWNSPPFEPTIKDGQIFARGVSDNKGEIVCRLQAIKAYMKVYGKLPINIKFIIEGEEEIGSPHLSQFVEQYRSFALDTDAVIWEFGGKDADNIQQIYLGVKGILYLHLKTETIGRDVHSGETQFVNNAAYELVWALASLKDRNDKVLIPSFYDGIIPPTEEELKVIEDFDLKEEQMKESFGIKDFRLGLSGLELKKKYFLEPTLNICGIWGGYQGPGSKTVVPKEAYAKIDCRLVPGQEPNHIVNKLREYLNENGFSHIEITGWDGYRAAKTPISNPITQLVINVFRETYEHEPIIWPMVGGSGPMYLFDKVPCISIGTGHMNSNAHAPNENIFLDDWYKGMEAIANLIHNFDTKE